MLFNIYYINFPKVYEIKMMLSNVISLGGELHQDSHEGKDVDYRGKLGAKFLTIFSGEGEAGKKTSVSDSRKVLETFEIKTTKSVILNEIIEKSKIIEDLDGLREGELIRVDDIHLSLENEVELRTVKLFTNGSFKGIAIPGANGLDINNLFNSMFKDYAYKLKGILAATDEELIVKIPLTFESEFESSYSVDDLFIGRVSLIGVYKGKINVESLRNSFDFFQEVGSFQHAFVQPSEEMHEIRESQYTKQSNPFYTFRTADYSKEYHYIDLLAIVQNINLPKEEIN